MSVVGSTPWIKSAHRPGKPICPRTTLAPAPTVSPESTVQRSRPVWPCTTPAMHNVSTAVQPTALSFAALTCPPCGQRFINRPGLAGPARQHGNSPCCRCPRRLLRANGRRCRGARTEKKRLSPLPVQPAGRAPGEKDTPRVSGSEIVGNAEQHVERELGPAVVRDEGRAHLDLPGEGEVRL